MEEIIRELAEKYNMTISAMTYICESPFRFTREMMREGLYKGIMINHFGKFAISPQKKKFIAEKKKLRDEAPKNTEKAK